MFLNIVDTITMLPGIVFEKAYTYKIMFSEKLSWKKVTDLSKK
jgi:hypothetical protein